MRAQAARYVKDVMPLAKQVIEGKQTWSNQQVALFKALLGKVMPDVSAHYEERHVTNHNVHEMSREQLLEIASNSHSLLRGAEDAEFSETSEGSVSETCRDSDARDAPREAGGGG